MFERETVGEKHKHKPDGSNPTIIDRGKAYHSPPARKGQPGVVRLSGCRSRSERESDGIVSGSTRCDIRASPRSDPSRLDDAPGRPAS